MTATPIATDPRDIGLAVLDRLESAWNAADGAAFGRPFAPDASYVTVRGEHHVGRAAIGAGHGVIFRTIYAGSRNRMELIWSAEIADGVVVAVSRNTLDCPAGPLAGRHQALSTSVIVRSNGGADWQIVASHNTLVAG